jgi:hypothetical protein
MCPGGVDAMADIPILETLRGCLDQGAKNRLAAALERNPQLTYNEFWRDLEREYSRDLTSHYRREWEKVTLGGVRRLTPQMWRIFESEFSLKATRVGDVTEREMEERLLAELPLEVRRKLKEENYRVSRSRYWVRLMEPLPIPVPAMEGMLAALVGHPVTLKKSRKWVPSGLWQCNGTGIGTSFGRLWSKWGQLTCGETRARDVMDRNVKLGDGSTPTHGG